MSSGLPYSRSVIILRHIMLLLLRLSYPSTTLHIASPALYLIHPPPHTLHPPPSTTPPPSMTCVSLPIPSPHSIPSSSSFLLLSLYLLHLHLPLPLLLPLSSSSRPSFIPPPPPSLSGYSSTISPPSIHTYHPVLRKWETETLSIPSYLMLYSLLNSYKKLLFLTLFFFLKKNKTFS